MKIQDCVLWQKKVIIAGSSFDQSVKTCIEAADTNVRWERWTQDGWLVSTSFFTLLCYLPSSVLCSVHSASNQVQNGSAEHVCCHVTGQSIVLQRPVIPGNPRGGWCTIILGWLKRWPRGWPRWDVAKGWLRGRLDCTIIWGCPKRLGLSTNPTTDPTIHSHTIQSIIEQTVKWASHVTSRPLHLPGLPFQGCLS